MKYAYPDIVVTATAPNGALGATVTGVEKNTDTISVYYTLPDGVEATEGLLNDLKKQGNDTWWADGWRDYEQGDFQAIINGNLPDGDYELTFTLYAEGYKSADVTVDFTMSRNELTWKGGSTPTPEPTAEPTAEPTEEPTARPTAVPVSQLTGPKLTAAEAEDAGFAWTEADGGLTITAYAGNSDTVTVPAAIDGKAVLTVGDSAFMGDATLRTLTISAGVQTIGDYAFAECENLSSVTLPEGLSAIGEGAFMNTALTEITIPASVTELGANPFCGSANLKAINVASGSESLYTEDGVLFTRGTNVLVSYPTARGAEAYEVPLGTLRIGAMAISGDTGLKTVILPTTLVGVDELGIADDGIETVWLNDTLGDLGEDALPQDAAIHVRDLKGNDAKNCTAAAALTASGYTLTDDGTSVAAAHGISMTREEAVNAGLQWVSGTITGYTGSAESLTVPAVIDGEKVTAIGASAFADNSKLTELTLPDTVTAIGANAIKGTGVTAIAIPMYCTELDDLALSCDTLQSISVNEGNTAFSAGKDGILYNADGTTLVRYPAGKKGGSMNIGKTVTAIAPYAFEGCTQLTSVNTGDTVTTIGACAFSGSEKLKTVQLGKAVTTIGGNAFSGTAVNSLTLPASLTTMEENALSGMDALKTVKTGDNSGLARYGQYVTFGTYEQDNDTANGQEAIEWLVLDVQNGKALLISRCGLDTQPYNTTSTDVTWETCTLRTWLNSDFLNAAFTDEERTLIATTTVDNSKKQCNSNWSTNGGKNTQDQIFLLSYAEAEQYFSSNEVRMCVPTNYAVNRGAYRNKDSKVDGHAAGWWWLRSPGLNQLRAAYVLSGGSLSCSSVHYGSASVRPAFWVDLASGIF